MPKVDKKYCEILTEEIDNRISKLFEDALEEKKSEIEKWKEEVKAKEEGLGPVWFSKLKKEKDWPLPLVKRQLRFAEARHVTKYMPLEEIDDIIRISKLSRSICSTKK